MIMNGDVIMDNVFLSIFYVMVLKNMDIQLNGLMIVQMDLMKYGKFAVTLMIMTLRIQVLIPENFVLNVRIKRTIVTLI